MNAGSRVRFGEPVDITLPAEDGQSIRLPFTVVPSEAAGTDLEPGATTRHELIVRLSGTRASSWGVDPEHGRAVMIHAAVEHLFEAARRGRWVPSEEIRIDDETFPGPLPDRFDRAIHVAGSTMQVEPAGD